jgi:hypothetical protein
MNYRTNYRRIAAEIGRRRERLRQFAAIRPERPLNCRMNYRNSPPEAANYRTNYRRIAAEIPILEYVA